MLPFLLSLTLWGTYQPDYKAACELLKPQAKVIMKSCQTHQVEPALMCSVVFPELTRYSWVSNLMETKALELLYTQNGPSMADFSIGLFQMKPSFVETLEQNITAQQGNSIYTEFAFLTQFVSSDPTFIRAERLQRLKNPEWQSLYVCAFCKLLDAKFVQEHFSNFNEKLRFYAAAYNLGLNASAERIKAWTNAKCFPFGSEYHITQPSYADVAETFYMQYYPF